MINMLYKFREVCCLLLVLTTSATLVTVAVDSCKTNKDCPDKYYCDGETCMKCLSCKLLFREGSSCIADFNECGDCLAGYEEISVTINSVVKKPCKLFKKNVEEAECSTSVNLKNCPPNSYCNEGSCVKCFNCTLMNRLPPANNCATSLTECGSCRNGYHEVSVTTLTNMKPCDMGQVKEIKTEPPDIKAEVLAQELPFLFVIYFIMLLIFVTWLGVKIYKKYKGKKMNKSIPLCTIQPSAPPLYVEDLMPEKRFIKTEITDAKGHSREEPVALSYITGQKQEEPIALFYITEQKQEEPVVLSYITEQKQEAKVSREPTASYYVHDQRTPHNESAEGQDLLRMNASRLSLQLVDIQLPQQRNETNPENHESGNSDMVDLGGEEVPVEESNNPSMEPVEVGLRNIQLMSPFQQPVEMDAGIEDSEDNISAAVSTLDSERVNSTTEKKI